MAFELGADFYTSARRPKRCLAATTVHWPTTDYRQHGAGRDRLRDSRKPHEQFLARRLRDAGSTRNRRPFWLSSGDVRQSGRASCSGSITFKLVGAIRNGDINAAEVYAAKIVHCWRTRRSGMCFRSTARLAGLHRRRQCARLWKHAASLRNPRPHITSQSALYRVARRCSKYESKPAEGELERSSDWALALEGRAKVSKAASAKAKRMCAAHFSADWRNQASFTSIRGAFSASSSM